MTLSNYAENALGNHALRGATAPMTAVAQAYLALYSTDPTDTDTGTELTSTGGYAREAINFSAPTNGVFPNSNAPHFPTGTTLSSAAFSGAAAFMGIRDASTAGNLLWYGPCISSTPVDFVAKPSLFQSPAHGFTTGDLVVFWGDNLPAGLTQGTRYFVIATGLTTDAFAVSTTSGGASITLTGNGSGRVAKDGTQTVTGANQQIIIPIGNVLASLQ